MLRLQVFSLLVMAMATSARKLSPAEKIQKLNKAGHYQVAPGQIKAADSTGTITAGPQATLSAQADSCTTVSELIDYCADSWDSQGDAAFTSCMCCSGTTFMPDYMDDAAGSCANYLATASPSYSADAEQYSSLASFCSIDTDSSDPCSPQTTEDYGCYAVTELVSYCMSETPSFTALPESSQAECLCYYSETGTTTWDPYYFDDYVSECASWASDVDGSVYTAYASYEDLCSYYGDFLDYGTGETTTDSSRSTSTDSGFTAAQTGQSATTGSSAAPTAVTVTVAPTATASPGAAPKTATFHGGDASSLMIFLGAMLLSSLWFMLIIRHGEMADFLLETSMVGIKMKRYPLASDSCYSG
ncbi:hypothetical protein F5Y15DRAFT_411429 [Xylariaceae sp. FL0016]|nr:hypothetical protein F5Y15DRAFT_411429 [Xylariaceae sp. FL0016]